ncbi:hypothetical protein B0H12DRAFT_604000 [Mycena haematopus]|nr:hypothetical protein B0H12DRAFT_604000 [Mycena haematopus]
MSAAEMACLAMSGADRGKSVGLDGLDGLVQTTTDLGHFPDNHVIRTRGYATFIPLGRSLTQQEEKNDADEDDEESDSGPSNGPPSVGEDVGENSTQDLDASTMEDMDDNDEEDEEEDEDDEEEVEESSET